ncbi:tryptophan 7-halogenase [Microbulbifer sp. CAU 1566]|uniref:tryptophan halogenase family protein n=1 Tax=Microbulbifer sp. CAU 1566 TaxID=2933269 RepID=UPI00200628E3|nr:tryptophan halogenase family protein [Microbulbifer sp. CAU 1566]MCK7598578.1 tryptophan 7-halogenase [Microbulbifer sp. CAU 1566]
MGRPNNRIVIAGGGTAGWMTAAALSQHFGSQAEITLVESSKIGSIGVGEATIPTIRNFYRSLGMQDLDVIRATQATCKLGIQFNNWHKPGSSFIHPFGTYGQNIQTSGQSIDFHQLWLQQHHQGKAAPLGEYSLGVTLAEAEKFTFPSPNPPSSLWVYDWALHFDAALFAQLMKDHATSKGVRAVDAVIHRVSQHEDGRIKALHLEDGSEVEGDLFIDCSGFRALLIEETLGVPYENWQYWLLCDSAVAVQSERVETPKPYTRVNAETAGWQWRIPLQQRDGNGHVYASEYLNDERAEQILRDNIPGQLTGDPRRIRFTPGRRVRTWEKNCIAIGLAAGFLEPLESTSIALIETAIEKIKTLVTHFDIQPSMVNEFNQTTALEYLRVRDFLILHYKATARDDSDFWRYCRNMSIPDTLQHKLDLFLASGHIVNYRWEMFHQPSWLAIFSGFDLLPDHYDLRLNQIPEAQRQSYLEGLRSSLRNAVAGAPDHYQFIREHGAAAEPDEEAA